MQQPPIVLTAVVVGALLISCRAPAPRIEAGAPSTRDPTPSPTDEATPATAVDCETLEAEPVVDGPLSSDPEVAAWQQARARVALASDEGTVRRIVTETAGSHYPFGFPHTEAEFDELMGRNPDPARIEAIRSYGTEHADQFGGTWLDQTVGGVVVVAFTGDVEEHRAALGRRVGLEGLRLVEVAVSERELESLRADIAHDLLGPPEPGRVFGLGTREQLGRVALDVLDPDDRLRAELAARYGADRVCLIPHWTPTVEDAEIARWEPAADADLSPSSQRIGVLVNERACAGGSTADGRIAPPDITYRQDAVVVTIRVIPVAGAAECPGNPDTPFTLILDEPLGERRLLDGGNEPPSEPSTGG